jgi:succinate dehydrogenase / fumarate reductase flavoprotein subunit
MGREKDSQEQGVSRRSFLKGSGLLAWAAAGATVGMVGCTGAAQAPEADDSNSPLSSTTEFDALDCDVLIVGGGAAACLAALQANKEGHQVTMVDKGPFRSSGASGLNWDAGTSGPPTVAPAPEDQKGTFPGSGIWVDDLSNKKLGKKAVEWAGSEIETWNRLLTYCRLGNTSFLREEDGSLEKRGGTYSSVQMIFTRHPMDFIINHTSIEVIDETMVTGLLIVDGKCPGVIGLHVPTGRYRVLRSKATIIANGGSTQMYGWSGTGAISINSPDNTGDVDMAAFRSGCSLIDTEFFSCDMISRFPDAIGGSFCSGIGADSVSSVMISDSNGKYLFGKDMEERPYGPITTECSQAVLNGGGSENDCLYLDLSQPGAETLTRPAYRRNIALWKKVFGIDVLEPGNKVEISVEPFEHMGNPIIDEYGMTEIPGLFNVRGVGTRMMLLGSHWLAPYVGHCAADYASDNELNINDWSSVQTEITRLEGILSNEGSIRPHEIRHSLQRAVFDALHVGANADGLNAAIAEIKRIRDEDLPKMAVSNKTRCYNTDWRKAIENHNLVDMSLACLETTLMREESRGFFFRSDFPAKDDENWLAHILVKYNSGSFEYEKVSVVEV